MLRIDQTFWFCLGQSSGPHFSRSPLSSNSCKTPNSTAEINLGPFICFISLSNEGSSLTWPTNSLSGNGLTSPEPLKMGETVHKTAVT